MIMKKLQFAALITLAVIAVQPARPWVSAGHRAVNQLALAALPTNFPAFIKSPETRERIAFLGGEPDRWRNITDDQALPHFNNPDHYLDIEQLADYGLTPETVPAFRYDFVAKLAIA